MSGEIIQLSNVMSLIFECRDLSQASVSHKCRLKLILGAPRINSTVVIKVGYKKSLDLVIHLLTARVSYLGNLLCLGGTNAADWLLVNSQKALSRRGN